MYQVHQLRFPLDRNSHLFRLRAASSYTFDIPLVSCLKPSPHCRAVAEDPAGGCMRKQRHADLNRVPSHRPHRYLSMQGLTSAIRLLNNQGPNHRGHRQPRHRRRRQNWSRLHLIDNSGIGQRSRLLGPRLKELIIAAIISKD